MSDQFCDKEAAVIRAARSGKWEPSLRAHHDSCAVCREAAKIVTAMSSMMLAESSQIPPTPDPQRVWLKAAFAERQKRSAKITQLAAFVYAVLAAAVGVGLFTMVKSSEGIKAIFPSPELTTTSIAPILIVIGCVLLAFLLSSLPARKSR